MPKTRAVQKFRDESLDLEARIIAAIGSVGPRNVAQIARLTGAHQETIRYKIKKRFAGRGFRFQAEVDYSRLGLSLYWAKLELHPLYNSSASKFFNTLNTAGYLVHYSKIVPGGSFIALFTLPSGRGGEFERFLDRLLDRRIITNFSLSKVLVERHKPMDVRHFNFQKDRWEVDWQKVKTSLESPLSAEEAPPSKMADEVDMLMIKELQIDGLQHTVGIARKLKMNGKTLEYHYRTHIVGRKLVPRYRVRWMRDLTRAVGHATLIAVLTFGKLHEDEYRKVQRAVTKIPHLWVEYRLKDGTYIAILGVPTGEFMEVMGYVNDELPVLGAKVEAGFMRVGESFNFTIPYHMFSDGEWRFDAGEMEEAVLKELSGGVKK
jgi:DNA-binding Lrp family transcriptional regulator